MGSRYPHEEEAMTTIYRRPYQIRHSNLQFSILGHGGRVRCT